MDGPELRLEEVKALMEHVRGCDQCLLAAIGGDLDFWSGKSRGMRASLGEMGFVDYQPYCDEGMSLGIDVEDAFKRQNAKVMSDGGWDHLTPEENLKAHCDGLHRDVYQALVAKRGRYSDAWLRKAHTQSHDRLLNDGMHGLNYRGES